MMMQDDNTAETDTLRTPRTPYSMIRQENNDVDEDDEDAASKAYASLSSQLDQWTSPKKARSTPNSNSSNNNDHWRTYEDDAVQWMETTFLTDDNAGASDEGAGGNEATTKTPKKKSATKTKDEESSPETPVRSNSAKKDQPSPLNLNDIPLQPRFAETTNNDYRLYHDALVRYHSTLSHTNPKQADVEYLSTLALDSTHYPLWSLLSKLRSLELDALWMKGSSQQQQQQQIADVLMSLSRKTATTDFVLIQELSSDAAPLVLKRRKLLMEWMHCVSSAKELSRSSFSTKSSFSSNSSSSVTTTMWPDSQQALKHGMQQRGKITTLHPDAPLLVSESLYGKDAKKDDDLLKSCLEYILAGRIDRATELCKGHGQPWRAAIWQGGGYPLDSTDVISKTTGNPHRFLWKSQCRALARACGDGPEAAIYAILSNDTATALSNPCIRSNWYRGLYACLSSMTGRLEDELLHRSRAHVRQQEQLSNDDSVQHEMEHLLATANAASMTEVTLFHALEASPHATLHLSNLQQRLVAAFIQGQNAVRTLLHSPFFQATTTTDAGVLRIIVHVVMYLNSTPGVDIEGLDRIQEEHLLHYLEHLARRPDLIQYATIYASKLPTSTLLQVFPPLLTSVYVPDERKLITTQLSQYLQHDDEDYDLTLEILKRVVQIIMEDKTTTKTTDVVKCQSIGWLCMKPSHYPAALEAANALCRQLLLSDDKTHVASQFLWDYFPTLVELDTATESPAKREHDAFLVYLEAQTAFDNWKSFMMDLTETDTLSYTSKRLDMTKLNEAEQNIARTMEQRRWLTEMRKTSSDLVTVAHAAYSKLVHGVLQFEGGWLQQDDADTLDSELTQLQSRLIPQVVFMAHNVCTETAAWLGETMLQQGLAVLVDKKKKNDDDHDNSYATVLVALDNHATKGTSATSSSSKSTVSKSPLSPLYWLHYAHDLANQVASEEYSVYDAFTSKDDLKLLLQFMEDVTIRILEQEAKLQHSE